eukprot:7381401-Prymnesium_polylepis.2
MEGMWDHMPPARTPVCRTTEPRMGARTVRTLQGRHILRDGCRARHDRHVLAVDVVDGAVGLQREERPLDGVLHAHAVLVGHPTCVQAHSALRGAPIVPTPSEDTH